MTQPVDANHSADPYNLHRFLQAQERDYAQALSEIRRGKKQSHWIWYIFPQLIGLGSSPTSQHYAIKSLNEATAYLQHPTLGPRLRECCMATLAVEHRSAYEIFGSPDDMKLRSCVTLFAQVARTDSVFEQLIDKYFDGQPDPVTLQLIDASRNES